MAPKLTKIHLRQLDDANIVARWQLESKPGWIPREIQPGF